jgi:hypothetical protein
VVKKPSDWPGSMVLVGHRMLVELDSAIWSAGHRSSVKVQIQLLVVLAPHIRMPTCPPRLLCNKERFSGDRLWASPRTDLSLFSYAMLCYRCTSRERGVDG